MHLVLMTLTDELGTVATAGTKRHKHTACAGKTHCICPAVCLITQISFISEEILPNA